MEEVVGLYTGYSTLPVTPEVLRRFSNIVLMIFSSHKKGRFVAGGRIHSSTTGCCRAVTGVVSALDTVATAKQVNKKCEFK